MATITCGGVTLTTQCTPEGKLLLELDNDESTTQEVELLLPEGTEKEEQTNGHCKMHFRLP